MKKHTITTKSWHYKFTSRFTEMSGDYAPSDICGYRRKFMRAFVNMLVIYFLIAIFVALPIVDTACWLAASISSGHFYWRNLNEGTQIWLLIVSVISMMFLVGWIYACHKERQAARRAQDRFNGIKPSIKEPGTIAVAYRSMKEKFCVKVDFK